MAIEIAYGLAEAFSKFSAGTPAMDERNGHKLISLATGDAFVIPFLISSAYASGSNATLKITGCPVTATSGTLKLQISIEELDGLDIDGDSFATAVAPDADPTLSGTSGVMVDTTWTLDNTELDTIGAGKWGRLKIERISTGDTMSGRFQVYGFSITQ